MCAKYTALAPIKIFKALGLPSKSKYSQVMMNTAKKSILNDRVNSKSCVLTLRLMKSRRKYLRPFPLSGRSKNSIAFRALQNKRLQISNKQPKINEIKAKRTYCLIIFSLLLILFQQDLSLLLRVFRACPLKDFR